MRQQIMLPADDSGSPDWQFMHDFMQYREYSMLLSYLKAKTC